VDELHVTFIALREAIPDLGRLAEYTAAAVTELEADLARGTRRKMKTRPRKPTARRAQPKRARKPGARRSPRRSPVR
jgi:hypothetical protein